MTSDTTAKVEVCNFEKDVVTVNINAVSLVQDLGNEELAKRMNGLLSKAGVSPQFKTVRVNRIPKNEVSKTVEIEAVDTNEKIQLAAENMAMVLLKKKESSERLENENISTKPLNEDELPEEFKLDDISARPEDESSERLENENISTNEDESPEDFKIDDISENFMKGEETPKMKKADDISAKSLKQEESKVLQSGMKCNGKFSFEVKGIANCKKEKFCEVVKNSVTRDENANIEICELKHNIAKVEISSQHALRYLDDEAILAQIHLSLKIAGILSHAKVQIYESPVVGCEVNEQALKEIKKKSVIKKNPLLDAIEQHEKVEKMVDTLLADIPQNDIIFEMAI